MSNKKLFPISSSASGGPTTNVSKETIDKIVAASKANKNVNLTDKQVKELDKVFSPNTEE